MSIDANNLENLLGRAEAIAVRRQQVKFGSPLQWHNLSRALKAVNNAARITQDHLNHLEQAIKSLENILNN